MAKPKATKVRQTSEQDRLLDEVQSHMTDSTTWLSTRRDEWDELEAMLIVKNEDSLSKTAKSKVFDPRLSTIVYERSARVMAQNPKGKAYAQSKDDIGKNMLMNLLLGYYEKNANEQGSTLIKMRMWDLYSLVYGSMFSLVPWRVNQKNGYIGPELLVLPIRDCFPQPHVRSINDADWFQVRTVTSMDWLKKQDPDTWMNIDQIEAEMKAHKDGGDTEAFSDKNSSSFIERTWYPGIFSDVAYPKIELITEYRHDTWITWAPRRINSKTSKPYVLRMLKDPYPKGMLPVVAKHAFPLIDSPIGLGEFARGKTMQYAINSLWNLYLDGVKYSIFPPLHINAENVVPSSIKWGAGEFWFMNNPNVDVQPMNISPRGLDTFQSTFGTLVGALESQAGTTSVSENAQSKSALGKTPAAVQYISQREQARDEWDRVMMEEAIKEVYDRWIALTVDKMETNVEMRLFGDEIEDIKEQYPDVLELSDSGKRGTVKVNKKMIDSDYDFVLESGSTLKPNIINEQENITNILKAILENPALAEALQAGGKTININELFKRWLIAGGVKDYDKIVVDQPEETMTEDGQAIEQMAGEEPMPEQMPQPEQPTPEMMMQQQAQPQMTPEMLQQLMQQQGGQQMPQQPGMEGIADPDIANAAMEFLGGIRGIPRQ